MTVMGSLTLVLVTVLALVFLQETLEPVQWIGVVLIVASGFVTQSMRVDRH